MDLKTLVRYVESNPISIQEFYSLATSNNLSMNKIQKYLIRLERLRKRLK